VTHSLTPDQEAVANKLDTAGLALIGAGVVGEVMHRHGAPGGMVQRIGHALHSTGPYTDLAGLALIAPPVMHPLARAMAPEKPKTPTIVDQPRAAGEIPVASTMPDEADAPEDELAAAQEQSRRTPPYEVPPDEPNAAGGELDRSKIASYQQGALAARRVFGLP